MIHTRLDRHVSFWIPILLLAGIGLLVVAALMGQIAHAALVTSDSTSYMQVTAQPTASVAPTDVAAWIGAISGGLALLLTVAFQFLKVIAPRTETKIDDDLRDAIGEILDHVRGATLKTTTVVVAQPAATVHTAITSPGTERTIEGGFARPLLLVILAGIVLGCGAGFCAVGCAAAKRAGPAAEHASIVCGKEYASAIAAEVAAYGVRSLIAGKVDWPTIETLAQAAGLQVGSCAVGEFLRAWKAQPETQVAARGGEPDTIAQGRAVLARVSDGAPVQLADGTVVQ